MPKNQKVAAEMGKKKRGPKAKGMLEYVNESLAKIKELEDKLKNESDKMSAS